MSPYLDYVGEELQNRDTWLVFVCLLTYTMMQMHTYPYSAVRSILNITDVVCHME